MTIMATEIASIPEVVAAQIDRHLNDYRAAGEMLGRSGATAIVTCARGTSDHAALYLKYLIEMQIGLPVCSMGPSIASIYDAPLRVATAPLIAISQSGGSRDICALTEKARAQGGMTLALLNVADAPLASAAGATIPMAAGPERAVAATKSYVCSLVALAATVAAWCRDDALLDGVRALPGALSKALECDWSAARARIEQARGLFVMSRGPGLSIAEEAALKFKETCNIHAEAYSAAEVLHGPVALADAGFSALSFMPRDAGARSVAEAVRYMRGAGAVVHNATAAPREPDDLPTVAANDPRLDPIVQIVSFYRFVEQVSVARGLNPDAPALLKKVTVTE